MSQFLFTKTEKKVCVGKVQYAVILFKASTGSLPTLKHNWFGGNDSIFLFSKIHYQWFKFKERNNVKQKF